MANWREPIETAAANAQAAAAICSSAAGIASVSAESSAADLIPSNSSSGNVFEQHPNEGAVPLTPMAHVKDAAFSTPKSSFSGGDQMRSTARRTGRYGAVEVWVASQLQLESSCVSSLICNSKSVGSMCVLL